MATYLGKDGWVSTGALGTGSPGTEVTEIRGWSVEHTAETIDDTVMGETSRGYKVTYKGFTGTVDLLYDVAATGPDAFTVGSTITVNFYPEDAATHGTPDDGDAVITGSAIVTGKTITAAYDGLIEASISLQGDGDLTFTTYTA